MVYMQEESPPEHHNHLHHVTSDNGLNLSFEQEWVELKNSKKVSTKDEFFGIFFSAYVFDSLHT